MAINADLTDRPKSKPDTVLPHPTTLRELQKRLVKLGCIIDRGRGGHWTVHLPNGRRTGIPCSPSDVRCLRNQVKKLRHKGADVRLMKMVEAIT
jgi:hypothetical protein